MSYTHITRRSFVRVLTGGFVMSMTKGTSWGSDPAEDEGSFAFGVIADAQYCDANPTGSRFYRASQDKLAKSVKELNGQQLAFTIHLGDFIDRDFDSFDALIPIYKRLQTPGYHVLGNHDFSVAADKLNAVPAKLGLDRRYYDFVTQGWRMIVLDGNDLSLIAHQQETAKYDDSMAAYQAKKAAGAENAQTWNGGLSKEQLAWLDERLTAADQQHERAIVFCHFPVYPTNVHNLWNDDQVREILEAHGCVVAYMNGHNHAGNYGQRAGIHYVTFQGMVETADTTAFAVVRVTPDALQIQGFGRAASRELPYP